MEVAKQWLKSKGWFVPPLVCLSKQCVLAVAVTLWRHVSAVPIALVVKPADRVSKPEMRKPADAGLATKLFQAKSRTAMTPAGLLAVARKRSQLL
jgi:hypothetical protein